MENPDAFGYALFCDDVRFEVAGKVSYIGVYDGVMYIQDSLPATLPKFVVAMRYSERINRREHPVAFHIYLPDQNEPAVVGEVPIEDIRRAPTPDVGESYGLPPPEFRNLRADIVLSPLEIKSPGIIRAVVMCGDDPLELGRLRVFPASKPKS